MPVCVMADHYQMRAANGLHSSENKKIPRDGGQYRLRQDHSGENAQSDLQSCFLADYYRDMPRWSFTLQLEFLIKRVQHHELISRVPKSCIQDRTLYEDPEIFAKYLNGLGYMDARELELYYDYFAKLHEGLHRPDKVICLVVQNVDVLLNRIRTRGRAEEANMAADFLRGLNAYYSVLPQILEKKYGVDVLTIDVEKMDIRAGEGKEHFLDMVNNFINS
jgi:deoxyadenosine/deoxycytidine kinase